MAELLFVYGTLRNPAVQRKIIGRETPGESAVLKGYKKDHIWIHKHIYPLLRQASKSKVKGEIIKVTRAELATIDNYETSAYRRVLVDVSGGDKQVWAYVR